MGTFPLFGLLLIYLTFGIFLGFAGVVFLGFAGVVFLGFAGVVFLGFAGVVFLGFAGVVVCGDREKKMSIDERIDWALWKLCKMDFQDDYGAWRRYVKSHPSLMKSLRHEYTNQNGVPTEAPPSVKEIQSLLFLSNP